MVTNVNMMEGRVDVIRTLTTASSQSFSFAQHQLLRLANEREKKYKCRSTIKNESAVMIRGREKRDRRYL